MGREFELKYRATPDIQAAISQAFDNFREITMESTYFDTADGFLSSRKMTLRLRKESGTSVYTWKTPLADGSRGEWECEAATLAESLARLAELGAPKMVAELAGLTLIPVCGARFIRLAAEIPTTDGTAELALDRGVLLGGGREIPLCEIEVERKTGSDEATLVIAQNLADQYGLQIETSSKFRRAQRLAKGE